VSLLDVCFNVEWRCIVTIAQITRQQLDSHRVVVTPVESIKR
jgi:hypothetical protein